MTVCRVGHNYPRGEVIKKTDKQGEISSPVIHSKSQGTALTGIDGGGIEHLGKAHISHRRCTAEHHQTGGEKNACEYIETFKVHNLCSGCSNVSVGLPVMLPCQEAVPGPAA